MKRMPAIHPEKHEAAARWGRRCDIAWTHVNGMVNARTRQLIDACGTGQPELIDGAVSGSEGAAIERAPVTALTENEHLDALANRLRSRPAPIGPGRVRSRDTMELAINAVGFASVIFAGGYAPEWMLWAGYGYGGSHFLRCVWLSR